MAHHETGQKIDLGEFVSILQCTCISLSKRQAVTITALYSFRGSNLECRSSKIYANTCSLREAIEDLHQPSATAASQVNHTVHIKAHTIEGLKKGWLKMLRVN